MTSACEKDPLQTQVNLMIDLLLPGVREDLLMLTPAPAVFFTLVTFFLFSGRNEFRSFADIVGSSM